MARSITVRLLVVILLTVIGSSVRAQNTDSAWLLNNQGVEFYERGNYAGAIEKFIEAIKFDPDNSTFHANLGYSAMAAGDHKNAVKAFKNAIARNPEDLDAHNNLGIALYNLGQIDQAVDEWTFVLKQNPGHIGAAANLGMARRPELAQQVLNETYAALSPQSLPIPKQIPREKMYAMPLEDVFSEGKLAYIEGRYDEAVKLLDYLLTIKPESKFSHYYLGLSYAFSNNVTDAMKHLREYMVLESLPPENKKTYNKSKEIFNRLRFGEVLHRDVDVKARAASLFEKGKKAYLHQDYMLCISLLEEARKIKSESYSINFILGMAYRNIGDRERSILYLTKCLLAGPASRSTEDARKIASMIKAMSN